MQLAGQGCRKAADQAPPRPGKFPRAIAIGRVDAPADFFEASPNLQGFCTKLLSRMEERLYEHHQCVSRAQQMPEQCSL